MSGLEYGHFGEEYVIETINQTGVGTVNRNRWHELPFNYRSPETQLLIARLRLGRAIDSHFSGKFNNELLRRFMPGDEVEQVLVYDFRNIEANMWVLDFFSELNYFKGIDIAFAPQFIDYKFKEGLERSMRNG